MWTLAVASCATPAADGSPCVDTVVVDAGVPLWVPWAVLVVGAVVVAGILVWVQARRH